MRVLDSRTSYWTDLRQCKKGPRTLIPFCGKLDLFQESMPLGVLTVSEIYRTVELMRECIFRAECVTRPDYLISNHIGALHKADPTFRLDEKRMYVQPRRLFTIKISNKDLRQLTRTRARAESKVHNKVDCSLMQSDDVVKTNAPVKLRAGMFAKFVSCLTNHPSSLIATRVQLYICSTFITRQHRQYKSRRRIYIYIYIRRLLLMKRNCIQHDHVRRLHGILREQLHELILIRCWCG